MPEGPEWTYEIKLDGYRPEAVRSAGDTTLFSRRENILNKKVGFILTRHTDIPRENDLDFLAQAKAAFAPLEPKKASAKKSTVGKEAKAKPELVKPAPKKNGQSTQAA